ncbi:MAG: site-specific DNA-methyltransferase [SAR202 cluster bacterium]|jgi:site-specific DNA-methyltransferase (adenine-specific)|nr:site-specific DNA-methyltransferase [SAR202 cluster bacterium]|tara:strand:+ start:204 stop:1127 length:924 start_codon:yes stop_codon:yes gene_type:complete
MAKSKTKDKKSSTKTSSFGTSGRRNHDSSDFYNSRLYKNLKNEKKVEYIENKIPNDIINNIYCKSSEKMDELNDSSVHLMITSPPYNVSKDYDDDLSLDEYRSLLKNVWEETYRVLVPGGRVCINVANIGRKPYIPLHTYIILDMLDIGFFMRGEIIWNKGSSSGGSTAWGSWKSASNPTLRDIHEYILVFSKDTFSRKRGDRIDTIEKQQFLDWTKSIWSFSTVSAKKIGHPAPFPEELPNRLIQLYSFENDVVLDPFVGSGQTCISSIKNNRNYIGYDIDENYVQMCKTRISTVRDQMTIFDDND